MFTFDELCQLIRVVSETRVSRLEVEREGLRVRIDGVPVGPVMQSVAGPPLLSPQLAAAAAHVPMAHLAAAVAGVAARPARRSRRTASLSSPRPSSARSTAPRTPTPSRT